MGNGDNDKSLKQENEELRDIILDYQEELFVQALEKEEDAKATAMEADFNSYRQAEEEYWAEQQHEQELEVAYNLGVQSQDKAVSDGLRKSSAEAGRAMRARRKDV